MFFFEERINRILNELGGYIYPDSEPVSLYKMKQGNFKGGEKLNLDVSDWVDFHSGDRWGGRDIHCWFRCDIKIPERFNSKKIVYTLQTGREGGWDALNPQFIIFKNEELIQGLDVNHRQIIVCENAEAGQIYHIALHAYSGMNEGLCELNSKICIIDSDIEKLYYNIKVPLQIAMLLDKEDKKRIDIVSFLNETINLLDLRQPHSESFNNSIKEANNYLETEFYGKHCGHDEVIAHSVGHTHIDVAWLWTLAQTREKSVRSFSTVLNLMEQYPEYIFMSSQPQLYKYVKEDYPEVFEKIKQKIKEGKWEPEGAMWLEADCNISSGESLVRQILFGTRFFKKEFDVENKILWLPDVFGYSAALPQILKKSGIDYFMTTKISWNEYNKMPYDTFMWSGLDGTEILTHFIPTKDYETHPKSHFTTYNGNLVPSQVMGAWQRYQQKNLNNEVLISYGYGDGGGGPTKEMIENGIRMAKGIPGCPKVKFGKSLDFFKKLEKDVSNNKYLPKWVGELYLEYHRGTLTSMARNKKFNRKSEFLYQDVEFLYTINSTTTNCKCYPQEEINNGWETILLNQFHDILPGSSIKEVYEDSKKQYIEIIEKGNTLKNNAIDSITSSINLNDTSVVVFNQLSFDRSDIVEFDLPDNFDGVEVYDNNGTKLASQVITSNNEECSCKTKVVFFAENVPAKGYKAFSIKKACSSNKSESGNLNVSKELLCNKFFDIKLDENCNIVSIFDKTNCREVLKSGRKANVLQAFEDKPHNYDAWDINIYYQEKMWEINNVKSVEVVENGPVRSAVKITREFLSSTLEQTIYIYNDISRIDFATRIDWKEKQVLLKTSFPVDVHTNKATYEIQYGNVERPTHWNTSWDYARFEVCSHKWADLSEDSYGASLINDCKYGYDIKDSEMRLTLLKSATSPNEDADREIHEFVYSLYPHNGDWKEAGTIQEAYSLNCPMYAKVTEAHSGNLPAELSFVSLDRDNVVVEVVKKAEDSEDIIIRLYECYNRRSKVNLTFFKDLSNVWECDLMENNINTVEFKGNNFEFEINPYEIKTFKLSTK